MTQCKTGKRRFGTEVEALIEIQEAYRIQQKYGKQSTRREARYYVCPICKGYHLTSQIKKYRDDSSNNSNNKRRKKRGKK